MTDRTDRWGSLVTRVLAPNPGPMTLDGTNTLVIRHPSSPSAVVVDPGPADDAHLDRVLAVGPVELILLTHHHLDHVEAATALHERTGAPVRAADRALVAEAEPLADGEAIEAGGCRIEVLATPGHTADSVCFVLRDDEGTSVLTGDTILGRGTTVIADTGTLGDYLGTLERLRALGDVTVLPAHGERLPSLRAICDELLAHRRARLDEIEAALRTLGRAASADDDTVSAVVDVVYPEVDGRIRFAAEASARAQLEYLSDA
ncbi:MBL fold metallo-hydrolase [Microbacterium sp.]|uniref:MBL fold metallo-hydrolase n=1 Tax=Microbacterium sp. TaxID=51671 RepID=UPI0028109E65|nr:MBL fold metallo-hydrolase [Microbacterium sp.]